MSGWIKCSERLPEPEKRVLLAVKYASGLRRTEKGYLRDLKYYTRKTIAPWQGEHGVMSAEAVTHWMHMPDPPKDGE